MAATTPSAAAITACFTCVRSRSKSPPCRNVIRIPVTLPLPWTTLRRAPKCRTIFGACSISFTKTSLASNCGAPVPWYKPLMAENLVIRSATPDDIEAAAVLGAQIVRLHHAANPERFFLIDDVEKGYAWWLRQELDRAEAIVLVAELNLEIVAYAYGAIEERDWNLLLDRHGAVHDLFVVEAARRKGVGRAMVSAVIARLEDLGAQRIVTRTMVQNEAAQHLCKSLGFQPTMLEMTKEMT